MTKTFKPQRKSFFSTFPFLKLFRKLFFFRLFLLINASQAIKEQFITSPASCSTSLFLIFYLPSFSFCFSFALKTFTFQLQVSSAIMNPLKFIPLKTQKPFASSHIIQTASLHHFYFILYEHETLFYYKR